MASWLDDFIGKIFALDGVDFPLVGRINFRTGAGVALTPQVVEGGENEPTTLNLTIAADSFFKVHTPDPFDAGVGEDGYELTVLAPLIVDDEGSALGMTAGELHVFTVTLNLTAKTTLGEGGAKSVAIQEIVAWRADDDNAYIQGSGDDSGNLSPVRVLMGAGTLISWENAPITTEIVSGEPRIRIQDWVIPVDATASITIERKTVYNPPEPV